MKKSISIILILLVSGCIVKPSHVKEGDLIVLEMSKEIATQHPESMRAKEIYAKSTQHARQPGTFGLSDLPGPISSYLGGSAGVLGLGFSLLKMYEAKQSRELAKKVAYMNPEEAKDELIKSKVKV